MVGCESPRGGDCHASCEKRPLSVVMGGVEGVRSAGILGVGGKQQFPASRAWPVTEATGWRVSMAMA